MSHYAVGRGTYLNHTYGGQSELPTCSTLADPKVRDEIHRDGPSNEGVKCQVSGRRTSRKGSGKGDQPGVRSQLAVALHGNLTSCLLAGSHNSMKQGKPTLVRTGCDAPRREP